MEFEWWSRNENYEGKKAKVSFFAKYIKCSNFNK